MPLQRQIELKQEDAPYISNNGDYELNLLEPVYINEGDTIEIKNVFIDTRKTSAEGTINIEEDLPVELDIYKYIVDHTVEDDPTQDPNRGRDYLVTVKTDHPTGKRYVLSSPATVKTYDRVDSLNLLVSDMWKTGKNELWRTMGITWQYIDLAGDTQKFTISISKKEAFDFRKVIIDEDGSGIQKLILPSPFIMETGSLKFVDGTDVWGKSGIVARQKWFWDPNDLNNQNQIKAPPGKNTPTFNVTKVTISNGYIPYPEKLQFTVKAGQYTPDNLATLVTKNLSIITNNIVDINGKTLCLAGRFSTAESYIYSSEDGKDFYEVGPQNQFWLGSNQISLIYNSIQSKFEFDYLHMPFYSEIVPTGSADTNGAIVNKIIEVPVRKADGPPPTYGVSSNIIIGNAGGILINNWTSEFFEDILGFTSNNLVTINNFNTITLATGPVQLPILSLIDGVNSTSGFAGLDTLVKKTTPTWYLKPSFTNLESTTDITSSILAFNVIQPQQEEQFAYYNVQLEAGFNTDYIQTSNVKRNINCIVSKYYSVDSYTIFEGQGVIYEHVGAPQMLSRMKVRILDPDFKNPNIGTDNTMILLLNQNK